MAKRLLIVVLVLVLLVVVVAGALVGVLYWGYSEYVKPVVGVEFFDAVDLVVGMYDFNEAGIVTNPYDPDADLKSFNAEFAAAFGIEGGENIDFEKIFNGTGLEGYEHIDQEELKTLSAQYESDFIGKNQSVDDLLDSENPPAQTSVAQALGLEDEGEEPAPETPPAFVFPESITVTDKQLAAMSQEYFAKYVGESANLKRLSEALKGVDVSSFLQIAQLKVVNAGGGEKGSAEYNALEFSLTMRADFHILFDALAPAETPDFLKTLLPQHFYLTVSIFPRDFEKVGAVSANDFTEKQNTALKTMLGGISAESGGFDKLMITFNATVSELLGSIEKGYGIPFKFVKTA